MNKIFYHNYCQKCCIHHFYTPLDNSKNIDVAHCDISTNTNWGFFDTNELAFINKSTRELYNIDGHDIHKEFIPPTTCPYTLEIALYDSN